MYIFCKKDLQEVELLLSNQQLGGIRIYGLEKPSIGLVSQTGGLTLHITIQRIPLGNDLLFLVTGGKAHIGAVVTAYPAEGKREVYVASHSLPGHREEPLAAEFARAAAERYQCAVTVVMGVHKDHATKEEILDMVKQIRGAMQEELRREKNHVCS